MPKIKKFIECLLPVTACNLRCEYCYVIQEGRRHNKIPELKYTPKQIAKALSKERLGGVCYISICGAGETLLPDYMVDIIYELLKEGHYVNITNNGTMTERLKKICRFDRELINRLHFAFSLHYIELKKKGLLDIFFDNIKMVKEAGASFLVQFNLYDGYIPYLDEIKKICIENVGAMPQVAATRDESCQEFKLLTKHSKEEYEAYGKEFESPLFDFTMKNFMVKRNEFCYAGDWSFLLNLETGMMTKCYANTENAFNIFENTESAIPFEAIGKQCKHSFCVNSSHFMSLGIIPSIKCPSYADLRNRHESEWYADTMSSFLSQKLYENNKEYTNLKRILISLRRYYKKALQMKYRINTYIYHKIKKGD